MVAIKAENLRSQAFLDSFVLLSKSTKLPPAIKWHMIDAVEVVTGALNKINAMNNELVEKYQTEPGKVATSELAPETLAEYKKENDEINNIQIQLPFDGKIKITDEILEDISGQDLSQLKGITERG